MSNGVLIEGAETRNEVTDLTVVCDACGYTPAVVLDCAPDSSGEEQVGWFADPRDGEAAEKLRAAGFTV